MPLPPGPPDGSANDFYVDDFGDTSGNDDTAAFNACYQAAPAGARIIGCQGKNYRITSQLNWLNKQLILDFDGCTLDWYGSNPNAVFTITGASNVSPIVISAPTTGIVAGDLVYVTGIVGNTAANGWWIAQSVDASGNVTLQNTTGNGAWVSGGTIQKMYPMLLLGWSSGNALAAKSNSQPFVFKGGRLRMKDGLQSGFTQNSFIGLQWQNIYSGKVQDAAIDGFGINWLAIGDGTGCTTQKCEWRQMKNGGVNAFFYGKNAGGYISEIGIGEGDWIYGTDQQTRHIMADVFNGGNCGQVKFQGTTFQMNSNTGRWGDIWTGDHWQFLENHFETANHSAGILQFANGVTNSLLIGNRGPSTDLQVQDNNTSNPSNYFLPFMSPKFMVKLYQSNNAAGPNGTVSKTSLIGGGEGIATNQAGLTIPAFWMNRCRTLILELEGWITTDGSTPAAVTMELDVGGTTYTLATTNALPAGLTNAQWNARFKIVQGAIGTSPNGRIRTQGWFDHMTVNQNAAGGSTVVRIPLVSVGGTVNGNDVSMNINCQATLSIAAANNMQSESVTLWGS